MSFEISLSMVAIAAAVIIMLLFLGPFGVIVGALALLVALGIGLVRATRWLAHPERRHIDHHEPHPH